MRLLLISIIFYFSFIELEAQEAPTFIYESANLKLEKLSEHCYRHISYLQTEKYGKVGCNGMVVFDEKEAFVFDTPSEDSVSQELINVIADLFNAQVKGVIINHFHEDCLGGLEAFHQMGIPSYANQRTIELAKENGMIIPKIAFNDSIRLNLNNLSIINQHFGQAHTADNIVSYVVEDQVLFGGCQLKCLKAGKGYLGDAHVKDWPNTIRAIKARYPNLKLAIPGHGPTGGSDLLDYTIQLFE